MKTNNERENRIKIFCDFDSTITESAFQFISILNLRYGKTYTVDQIRRYNFTNLYPVTKEEICKISESDEFFSNLRIFEKCKEVILKYSNYFDWRLCSIGNDINILKKDKYLKNNGMGGVFTIEKVLFDGKSAIDMKNSVQIDDHMMNLRDSNAKIKILHKADGIDYPWNQVETTDENIYIVTNWHQVEEILEFIETVGINF